MLTEGQLPEWWPEDELLRVNVVEGGPDWLRLAAWGMDSATTPAVLGLWQGAFTETVASRIPAGAHVVVATDADPPGDRYAERVADLLNLRCKVDRFRQPEEVSSA